ncbi:MAG: LysM peptidoglycan-binding domain-containing protein [Hyphomicrobiaceae bacterium]
MAGFLNTRTTTFPLKPVRIGACIAVIVTAVVAGACSGGQSHISDRPGWSLADKLGSPAPQAKAEPNASPAYEYRGGRDRVTGKVPGTAPEGPRLIEIRKGDTLHGLSLTYHVSVKALMDANNLVSTTIVPGKKLVIPAS